jgi:hypothetical protein
LAQLTPFWELPMSLKFLTVCRHAHAQLRHYAGIQRAQEQEAH